MLLLFVYTYIYIHSDGEVSTMLKRFDDSYPTKFNNWVTKFKMFNLCGYFIINMFNHCGYFIVKMFKLLTLKYPLVMTIKYPQCLNIWMIVIQQSLTFWWRSSKCLSCVDILASKCWTTVDTVSSKCLSVWR